MLGLAFVKGESLRRVIWAENEKQRKGEGCKNLSLFLCEPLMGFFVGPGHFLWFVLQFAERGSLEPHTELDSPGAVKDWYGFPRDFISGLFSL